MLRLRVWLRDYGVGKKFANWTQIFRRKSKKLIMDETKIWNLRPYKYKLKYRRKNHGEVDDYLQKDEILKKLIRLFRKNSILAVIFGLLETKW